MKLPLDPWMKTGKPKECDITRILPAPFQGWIEGNWVGEVLHSVICTVSYRFISKKEPLHPPKMLNRGEMRYVAETARMYAAFLIAAPLCSVTFHPYYFKYNRHRVLIVCEKGRFIFPDAVITDLRYINLISINESWLLLYLVFGTFRVVWVMVWRCINSFQGIKLF